MNNPPLAKKSLGQHWLTDDISLEAMCDAAHVSKGDLVLEIGPGTGELTSRLLKRQAEVIALELDRTLTAQLQKRFRHYNSTQFFVQEGDIRTYDLSNLTSDYSIVANIPYYLTNYLLRLLSESSNPPQTAVLLVQKEVAERVTAGPGDMSLLSIMTQFYWETSKGLVVPARLFTPPPKVDSQILILKYRNQPLFADIDEKVFFRLVKAGFSARRKTLPNSLSAGLRVGKDEVHKLLQAADIPNNIRPQELSLTLWYEIYKSGKKIGLY